MSDPNIDLSPQNYKHINIEFGLILLKNIDVEICTLANCFIKRKYIGITLFNYISIVL